MRQSRRHDGEVPLASAEEAIIGEQLNCAAQHVEQLSRRGTAVGMTCTQVIRAGGLSGCRLVADVARDHGEQRVRDDGGSLRI